MIEWVGVGGWVGGGFGGVVTECIVYMFRALTL